MAGELVYWYLGIFYVFCSLLAYIAIEFILNYEGNRRETQGAAY